MIDFKQIEQQIQNASRMAGIIGATETKNDADIMSICFSEIEGLSKTQDELKPLIDSLENYTERMVISLRYLKGYSCPWIAEKLNISRATAYNYLFRAKRNLAEKYPERIVL